MPPDAIKTDFETGVARLEFLGADTFNLAYLCHNDKWFTLFEGVSLKEYLEVIE